jgi:sigma-B regulation protein RsbU (phosphoserine phosphatase)
MSELFDRIVSSKRSRENLSMLVEAAHLLNSTIEYEELMKNVLKLVTRAVDAESALVFRYDPSHKSLRIRFFSADDEPKQVKFKIGQGFVGWVAEHKQPVLSNNPVDDKRYSPKIKDLDIDLQSLLCVPLTLRGKFFGVVEAINRKNGGFDQCDLDTLDLLSSQIALAINNAQLYRTLKNQALQRKTLFEVSRGLLSPLTLDEVLHNILMALNKVVDFDAGSIYLINDKTGNVDSITSTGYDKLLEADLHLKIGQGIVGWVARTGKPERVSDTSKDNRYINARPKTRSELVVPVQSNDKMIGVLNLEHDRLDAFSNKDREILTTFATQAAISIERAKMYKVMLEQKKFEEQLSIARTIQETFLPDSVPQIKGYDIWGANIPSGEVGGDYYDFIKIVDHQLGISIADVSGKGIPAALIMASYRASLIAEIRNNYAIRSICQKVNNLLCESLEPGNFVTAIYGVLDSKNSIFTFSNCGHNPGLLIRSDDSVAELTEGGMLLGVRPDCKYEERPIYIDKGDILCLYTDGLTEAVNDSDDQFETDRMIEVLKRYRDLSAREIGAKMIDAVKTFCSNGHIIDDLTIIIIKRLTPS